MAQYPQTNHLVALPLQSIAFGGAIAADLFSEVADQCAQAVAAGRGQQNKPTQLRRFYDELVMWHEKIQQGRSADERQQRYQDAAPFIKMMKAKVAYAKGRDHIDDTFLSLFTRVVDEVNSADSLRYAKLFMEAFMGFYKLHKRN